MTISYNLLEVTIDRSAIRDNFTLIANRAERCMGVIKADAYGHGLLEVAEELESAGADTFAVGTVGEALQLRDSGMKGRVIALLGANSHQDMVQVAEADIIPFVISVEQIFALSKVAGSGKKIRIALKFDTGMARLGFAESDIPSILEALASSPSIQVELVASHLAVSEEHDRAEYTSEQCSVFSRIVTALRGAGLSFEASLANSGAILAHPETYFDIQRPGIALYGSNPLHGWPHQEKGAGLTLAMSVNTPILQVHDLPKGKGISYGLTHVAQHDMRVAIVSAGYADAYSRRLGNTAQVMINGYRAPVVGRVCMQMTAVDVTGIPSVQAGDVAWLLGGPHENPVSVEELAGWWRTCTYEVFCLLGMNPRHYI